MNTSKLSGLGLKLMTAGLEEDQDWKPSGDSGLNENVSFYLHNLLVGIIKS